MVISRVMGPPRNSSKRRNDHLDDDGRSGKRSQTGWDSSSSAPGISPLAVEYPTDDPIGLGLCTELQSRQFFDR